MQEIEDLAKQFAQVAERVKSGEPLFSVGFEVAAGPKKKRVYSPDQKAAKKAYMKAYRLNNKQKLQEKGRRYREVNRDKVLERKAKYREQNQDKLKQYRLATSEQHRARIRNWRAAHPMKTLEHNVLNFLTNGLPPSIKKLSRRTIPAELVQAKIIQLLINREVKARIRSSK